jgi:hypothetical protein
MIDVNNIPMLTRNITLTNNIHRKIIRNIYFTLLNFIQSHEKRGIFSHAMSAPRVDNPFVLHIMRQQGLISLELEGEIISGSLKNKHVSFKVFNLLLKVISILITVFLYDIFSLSIVLACILLSNFLWFYLGSLVMVCNFLYRGIKLSSIPGIHISPSLEKVGLVFTTNLTFSKQCMLINNQETTERFKGVILTIFLVCFPVGIESRYKHVERCSQVHKDRLDDLSILLLIVLSRFTQFQLELFDTLQIVVHSFK